MKVAAVQMAPKVGDFSENTKFIEQAFIDSCKQGAKLVLFPELALSGYTLDPEVLKLGAELSRDFLQDLLKLSRELDCSAVLGLPRIISGKLRNSTAVVKKKRQILFYDKTHLFRAEKSIFEPGEDYLVFKFEDVSFGLLTCYEIGFPEISRILALKGAQVILASFAFGKERFKIYDTATRARAIENAAFLVAASTTGKGLMDFIGMSRIVHPSGEVMAQLEEGEGIILADIDIGQLHHYRYEEEGDSHAYFKNRKPHLYKELCGEFKPEAKS